MKTKHINTRPISTKAYEKFVARINQVFASENMNRAQILIALDLYLEGREDYADGLSLKLRQALQFLLFDVDEAIKRSTAARNRRKTKESPAPTGDHQEATQAPPHPPVQPSTGGKEESPAGLQGAGDWESCLSKAT